MKAQAIHDKWKSQSSHNLKNILLYCSFYSKINTMLYEINLKLVREIFLCVLLSFYCFKYEAGEFSHRQKCSICNFLADTFKHALLTPMFANSDFVSKNHSSQLHNQLSFSANF